MRVFLTYQQQRPLVRFFSPYPDDYCFTPLVLAAAKPFQASPRQGFCYGGGSWLFLPAKARGGDNLGNGAAITTINL